MSDLMEDLVKKWVDGAQSYSKNDQTLPNGKNYKSQTEHQHIEIMFLICRFVQWMSESAQRKTSTRKEKEISTKIVQMENCRIERFVQVVACQRWCLSMFNL